MKLKNIEMWLTALIASKLRATPCTTQLVRKDASCSVPSAVLLISLKSLVMILLSVMPSAPWLVGNIASGNAAEDRPLTASLPWLASEIWVARSCPPR